MNKVLGIMEIRQKDDKHLENTLTRVSDCTDNIVVSDPYLYLTSEESVDLAVDKFDAEYTTASVSDINYQSYSPDWVFACYSNETPSWRFNYMMPSLSANPYVNTWRANFRYNWKSIDFVRIDKIWLEQDYPVMYRYIPEISYEWDGGLLPINQPGPTEDCMLRMFSRRFMTDEQREAEFVKFMGRKKNYDLQTVDFLESLIDVEVTITTAVD